MLKLRSVELVTFGFFLTACSVQGSSSIVPVVGTCDEFSYDKKTSIASYVTVPVRGEVDSSTGGIRVELKSILKISGYSGMDCKGQKPASVSQNIVEVDLTCQDRSFGTAFLNLTSEETGLGHGLFSLSNGIYGTFQFGRNLLLLSPA